MYIETKKHYRNSGYKEEENMTEYEILKLYQYHRWMRLQEEGFLTAGMIARATELGIITKKVAEELTGWFY